MEPREREESEKEADGDHDALPLPGIGEDVIGCRGFLRAEFFAKQRIRIDALPRLRHRTAKGTESRGRIDLVAARYASLHHRWYFISTL
jgi:hypothetical protein